jgi:hypothetical protein
MGLDSRGSMKWQIGTGPICRKVIMTETVKLNGLAFKTDGKTTEGKPTYKIVGPIDAIQLAMAQDRTTIVKVTPVAGFDRESFKDNGDGTASIKLAPAVAKSELLDENAMLRAEIARLTAAVGLVPTPVTATATAPVTATATVVKQTSGRVIRTRK